MKELECQILSVQAMNHDVYRILLQAPETACCYQAGQYILLMLEGGESPAFSLASSPVNWPQLELHVRVTPGAGLSSVVLEQLQRGGSISLKVAAGDAIWEAPVDGETPIIFLAASTGFSQAKSLIETALEEGCQNPFYLYWGVREAKDLYWLALAELWAEQHEHVHFIPVISDGLESDAWTGRTGLVHEAVVADAHDLSAAQVWACGSPGMVYAALDAFVLEGLHKDQMRSDVFAYAPRD
ncbi:NAD(P)H-flavin reductase [Pokkaliibacter sp. CJK22405]|uniref:NAD(P)H-flavin reductase n=1 Tax=Pokkaliibacter sp. CJK22405 TaxID=3384615 RepID=UPI003984CE22